LPQYRSQDQGLLKFGSQDQGFFQLRCEDQGFLKFGSQDQGFFQIRCQDQGIVCGLVVVCVIVSTNVTTVDRFTIGVIRRDAKHFPE
jgi:hypothetical protein